SLDASTYDAIVDRLRLAGYPVDQLVRTRQGSPSPTAALGASVRRLVWAVSAPPPPQRAAL
ncbi:MAG: hypothetical protein ACM32J_17650, partial [Rhizobacter sp.]